VVTTSRPPYGRSVRGNRWDEVAGLTPAEPPRVSVIVVHYQQQRELDRTLAALARQTHPAEALEVIVVDDGSPTPPDVPAGIRLLRQADEGFRAAAARNLGAQHATGDVLCFLDADTTPEPGYIERMARLPALLPETVTVGHRKHADLERLGSTLDHRRPGGGEADAIEAVAPQVELDEPEWLLQEYARSGDLLRADQRSYRFVISAVVACSRWFFDEVGGFDETFSHYGGEDWEWAHRAWLEGGIFAHIPDAVAWHDGPDWAGRDELDRRRAKNDETLQLSRLIPVTGSRGRSIRSAHPDILVRFGRMSSDAAAFIAVDSVLAALPSATAVVGDELSALFSHDGRVIGESAQSALAGLRPRVEVHVPHAVRVDGDGRPLATAVELVGNETLGSVIFSSDDGSELVIESRRAALRRERWDDASLFDTERRPAPWLSGIREEPNLAAYLGGW
jgi:GT2 family glycosyltransferase